MNRPYNYSLKVFIKEVFILKYTEMKPEQLEALYLELKNEYKFVCEKGLSLDLSRGKPGREQLDMMTGMLDCISRGGTNKLNHR